MNKVLYDELLKAINEADEESMVTDKEAEPDFTDQDDVENEEVPDIEDANDELKESIYEFLNDLKASGIPVMEDEVSNVIYNHITNIVESAKLVGINEGISSFKKAMKLAQRGKGYTPHPNSHGISGPRALAFQIGKDAARVKSAIRDPKKAYKKAANKKVFTQYKADGIGWKKISKNTGKSK
jgi:hypothetical protein